MRKARVEEAENKEAEKVFSEIGAVSVRVATTALSRWLRSMRGLTRSRTVEAGRRFMRVELKEDQAGMAFSRV